MSVFIDSKANPFFHGLVELGENVALTGAVTAGFGYLLHITEAIKLANPLQGAIYGAVAAVVHKVVGAIFDAMPEEHKPTDEQQFLIYSAASTVISTGVTVALGYPMSYTAGLMLLPATIASLVSVNLMRDKLTDLKNCDWDWDCYEVLYR